MQGLDAERDVLRESQRLASERDRELETLRKQVRFFIVSFVTPSVHMMLHVFKRSRDCFFLPVHLNFQSEEWSDTGMLFQQLKCRNLFQGS